MIHKPFRFSVPLFGLIQTLHLCCRTTVVEEISHPSDSNDKLSFMPDVPHVLKNLRTAMLNNEIELPSFIVEKYELPTAKASSYLTFPDIELLWTL